MDWFRLALAILATYRLAQLFSVDHGPFDVFERLRLQCKKLAGYWQGRVAKTKSVLDDAPYIAIYGNRMPLLEHYIAVAMFEFWRNTAVGLECSFCTGVWFAAFTLALVYIRQPVTDALLLWLAIAGGQAFLQEFTRGR